MTRLPLYCYVTSDEKCLLEQFLAPSASEFELRIRGGPQGTWGEILKAKAQCILDAARECPEFVYADLDVVILKPMVDRLRELTGCADIAFQADGLGGVCAGFIYVKSTDAVRAFWEAIVADPAAYGPNCCTGDQEAANRRLGMVNYAILPKEEFYSSCYALGGGARPGWLPSEYPVEARMIHANCVYRGDKEAVLNKYRALQHSILVNFPTRGRRAKCLQTLKLWENPLVKIVVTVDRDDASMNDPGLIAELAARGIETQIIEPAGKIAAMNAGVADRKWDILIVGQDDLEPRPGYAETILALWQKHFGESTDGVLHLDDGYRTDTLNTIVVMGRRYFDRFGYVYHPSYKALWCDNEFTDVSVKLGRVVRIARRIISHEWAGKNPDALLQLNESYFDADKANYLRRKALGFPLETVLP